MDSHELQNLRRSLAMLTPGQAALSREQALTVLNEVSAAQARLRQLREDLQRMIDTIDT